MIQNKTQKQKGNEAFKINKYQQAIQHYKKYLQTDHHDNIQALANISLAYFKMEQYENSIDTCIEVLGMDEKYIKCYYRRAMCRKEILRKDPNNKVQKYKLYYDSVMFSKFCDPAENSKERDEIFRLGTQCKEQIMSSEPIKLSSFERDLIQIQKDNLHSLALSWLDERLNAKNKVAMEEKKYKINALYKQLIQINRQNKNEEEKKILTELIKQKIKNMRKQDIQQRKNSKVSNKQTQNEASKEEEETKVEQTASQTPENISCDQKPEISICNGVINNKINQEKQQNEKQVQKSKVDSETQNKEAQKIFEVLSDMSINDLYKKYFGSSLTNARDVFIQFPTNLVEVITNSSISKNTKEELLTMISQKFNSFKLYVKNMPNEWKTQLNSTLNSNQIDQNIIEKYII